MREESKWNGEGPRLVLALDKASEEEAGILTVTTPRSALGSDTHLLSTVLHISQMQFCD